MRRLLVLAQSHLAGEALGLRVDDGKPVLWGTPFALPSVAISS
jgi:hypothetical protein